MDENATEDNFSVHTTFRGSDFSTRELGGKKVKLSLTYRSNAIGNDIRFSYFSDNFGEFNPNLRRIITNTRINNENWTTVSSVIDFPYDLNSGYAGIFYVHSNNIGDKYIDIKEITVQIIK